MIRQDITGRRVVIPAGEYAWTLGEFEGNTNLSAPSPRRWFKRSAAYYDNNRRGSSPFTADELVGRSFIVKYTRLFDY